MPPVCFALLCSLATTPLHFVPTTMPSQAEAEDLPHYITTLGQIHHLSTLWLPA